MSDIKKTQHFTTKAEEICGNLIKHIPENCKLIEPWVGGGDLLSLFPNSEWEIYDIEPNKSVPNTVERDTLGSPPDYKGKWVISNPPYLARNKAKDKTLFDLHCLNDLYKISIKTILDCDGGILIIPSNFIIDSRSNEIRDMFFSKFEITEANIYKEPVFESTTYSIMAFAFKKKETESNSNEFLLNIFYPKKEETIILEKKYNWRLGGDWFAKLNKVKSKFNRYTDKTKDSDYITDIKLYALDTRSEMLRLEKEKTHYKGKNTDRFFATLTTDTEITSDCEDYIISYVNKEINLFREKYHNLPFTTFRDYNRKRIDMSVVYKLATLAYDEYNKK